MSKKNKRVSKKNQEKALLKEIESKITETVKGYVKKSSAKKLEKKIHKAGKILAKSLTKDQITVAHKEKLKRTKDREVIS